MSKISYTYKRFVRVEKLFNPDEYAEQVEDMGYICPNCNQSMLLEEGSEEYPDNFMDALCNYCIRILADLQHKEIEKLNKKLKAINDNSTSISGDSRNQNF